MRSIAAVTTRSPEWRTAAMPATSSQRCMITPPCTLPAVLASPIPIHRLSTELERDGGRGSTAASLGSSTIQLSKEAGCQGLADACPP
jgi:hypothetical protein